mmetsp:Transcript_767/g.1451  ORF Transcript_767/g.1451 Transcript_767/m.1451 type:complete len:329 (-) Transcript_767:70-1056(-)
MFRNHDGYSSSASLAHSASLQSQGSLVRDSKRIECLLLHLFVILSVENALDILHHFLCGEGWIHVCLEREAQNLHIAELPEVVVSLSFQAIQVGAQIKEFLALRLNFELQRLVLGGAASVQGGVQGRVHRPGSADGGWRRPLRPGSSSRRPFLGLHGLRAPGAPRHHRGPRLEVLLLCAAFLYEDIRHRRLRPNWQGLALSSGDRIVVDAAAAALPLPEALHPLQELQIVLILCTDKLVNRDVPLNVQLVESDLQDLVVGDVLVLRLRHPVDLAHGYAAWLARVNDLAVDGTAGALFDLRQVHLQQAINPLEEVTAGDEEGAFHHAHC